MNTRTVALLGGALVTTLLLAGCSAAGTTADTTADPSTGASASAQASASSVDANQADIAFATGMVAHHEQAIVMAQAMLDKQGVDPRVTDLAQRIKAAQAPEIETMNGWLASWDASHSMDGMDSTDMGGMTEGDMSALSAATGAEADRLFLEQMTAHHEGAIEMAGVELQSGQNADAVALAQKIVDDQTAEIAEMKDLLASL